MKKLFTGLGLLIVALIVVLLVLNAYPQDTDQPSVPPAESESDVEQSDEIDTSEDNMATITPETPESGPMGGLVEGSDQNQEQQLHDECGIGMMEGDTPGAGCQEVSADPEPEPQSPPFVAEGCQVTGCSGHVCANADQEVITTCEWEASYSCYNPANTRCIQDEMTGQCGWEENSELKTCIDESVDEGDLLGV